MQTFALMGLPAFSSNCSVFSIHMFFLFNTRCSTVFDLSMKELSYYIFYLFEKLVLALNLNILKIVEKDAALGVISTPPQFAMS